MPAYLPNCKISINLLPNNHCLDYYGIVKWWFSNANIFSAFISCNSINNNCLSSALYLLWDIIYTRKGRINDLVPLIEVNTECWGYLFFYWISHWAHRFYMQHILRHLPWVLLLYLQHSLIASLHFGTRSLWKFFGPDHHPLFRGVCVPFGEEWSLEATIWVLGFLTAMKL